MFLQIPKSLHFCTKKFRINFVEINLLCKELQTNFFLQEILGEVYQKYNVTKTNRATLIKFDELINNKGIIY